MKLPPIGIQPTWFDEKSGRDARCCAAIPVVSAAPTRPVRMQWPRNLDVEVKLNILLLLAFTPSQRCGLYHPSRVMPALVAGIHVFLAGCKQAKRGCPG